MTLRKLHTLCAWLLVMLPCFALAGEDHLPLIKLADDHKRNYWQPEQVNHPGTAEAFQDVIRAPAVPHNNAGKIHIALIYPNADVSDFWTRSYLAMTRRLADMNIPYTIEEFESRQIEHSLQTRYVKQVLANKDRYDFVIFGPSELGVQAKNIDALAAEKSFDTFVWAFHTPLKSLQHQPLMWLDFSSAVGTKVLCDYMLERLGRNILFAMNRGIPGVTDDQRSGEFKTCVNDKGDWEVAYEHYGQYQKAGGADGAELVQEYYPEVRYLHNANTAMTMGALGVINRDRLPSGLFVTGWGGTALELQSIRQGRLNATPMRMNDDLGVATAEAIRFVLSSRRAELPRVYLGRITVAHDQMSAAELNALETDAFRYSGIGGPGQ